MKIILDIIYLSDRLQVRLNNKWKGNMMNIKIGDKVKYSGDGLRKDRDYYLNQGHPSKRNQALDFYNAKQAMRGEVTNILDAPKGLHYLGRFPFGYEIKWDNNTISKTMAYLVEAA